MHKSFDSDKKCWVSSHDIRRHTIPVVPVSSQIAPEMNSTDVINCRVWESYWQYRFPTVLTVFCFSRTLGK